MKSVMKKYRWLILLTIAIVILKFIPDKLPFLVKIDRPKSAASVQRSPKNEDDSLPKNLFYIPVTSVKYRAESFKEFTTNGEAFDPKVSPDGSKIVFVLKGGNKADLMLLDLQNGSAMSLDVRLNDISNPSWDAAGTKIVFTGRKDVSSEIFTYEIESKKLTQITNDPPRKKYWPRFSPYQFDQQYRIAYTSEVKGRKDIWWVRANGENDMPLTFSPENLAKYKSNPLPEWSEAGVPTEMPTAGGEFPEWSPNGFTIVYKGENNTYNAMSYSYSTWWKPVSLSVKSSKGILEWAPNQSSLLEYSPTDMSADIVPLKTGTKQSVLAGKKLTSMPAYFPDGKALAYTSTSNGKSILAVEPLNDPLGDVSNLWMYEYDRGQQDKITKNQLLLLHSNNQQIYSLYDSEFYYCNGPYGYGHARPYLVTSDAVLETFYATFAALLSYTERTVLVQTLTEFATNGYERAKAKNAPADVTDFFLTGLTLLKPDMKLDVPATVTEEVKRIQGAAGSNDSLFGKRISYEEFLVRGKYERDKDLQRYYQALKWFQAFKFDLKKEADVRWVTALQEIINEPVVYKPLEKIDLTLRDNIGESRYYGPMTLKRVVSADKLPEVKSIEPWVKLKDSYTLLPSIYTLDSFVFDELITHTDRPDTVGTIDNPRLLPAGMDVMAALGSSEAKTILLNELKEGRFNNYERRLNEIESKIASYSPSIWDSNLYQVWLGTLNALLQEPAANAPEFTHAQAWKRKELSTALGSWVNLRYETVAYVHGAAPECGEAGYEQVIIGMPKGYVEPNPEFFKRLNAGFDKLRLRFKEMVSDNELRSAIDERINKFQFHLKALELIAQKELNNEPLEDKEYSEILYIGRTVEHFILLMNSISPDNDDGYTLSNPDSIEKIVHVQTTPFGDKLYNGLGPANEVNVIVPFFGRRQIVKGPVYSYYEFASKEIWNNDRWQHDHAKKQDLPIWIKNYYYGTETRALSDN